MVYCFLADGFEEVEAIAPIDMLRRAGVEVKTVGVSGDVIDGRHGIKVVPDIDIKDITLDEALEAVILPGGLPGATNLEECADVQKTIDFAVSEGKLVCAICAAPQILGHKGLLEGKQAIAYPGFEDELKGAIISKDYVVRDGNFITAKGAGVATEFGLKIVGALKSEALAEEIGKAIQMK
jgi:4-methyl-5(b-hydroxyethyl)-thiazole monophosphate biosynthesis